MVPLNLGIRAHDLAPESLDDLIQKLHHYQFSCIQFAVKKCFPESVPDFQALSPGTASYYGMTFAREQIKIAVLGCYVNIVATDSSVRKKALADFNTHLRLARDFGASVVGTETGSVEKGFTLKNYTEEAFRSAVLSIKEMVAEAEKFGVTVAIEAGINHPLHTVEQIVELLEEVPSNNLQIILDCANLMSPENYQQQAEIVQSAFENIGSRIAAIHLKDFVVEDGKIKIVPVGKGWLDFEPILRYIKYQRPHIHSSLEATTEPHIGECVAFLTELYERL